MFHLIVSAVRRNQRLSVCSMLCGRYKPDDEVAHQIDQWGYTGAGPTPAMRLTDLTETKADLVEAFVPIVVKEAVADD